MEPDLDGKNHSGSEIQVIYRILCNNRAHYLVHKRPPLKAILSQMYPIDIIIIFVLRSILILSFRLCLILTHGHFLQLSQ
jgi:hypothetical protein